MKKILSITVKVVLAISVNILAQNTVGPNYVQVLRRVQELSGLIPGTYQLMIILMQQLFL